MKALHTIAFVLVIIGGLNWLLVVLDYNLVDMIIGRWSSGLANLVYVLVGLSAVYLIFTHKATCRACGNGSSM